MYSIPSDPLLTLPKIEDPFANVEKSYLKQYDHNDTLFCVNCGEELKEHAKFCGKCGSRLKKRDDRRSDWGSNRKETTAIQDEREVLLQKLRKLGELKDRGMLSDEEFSAAKANLLQ